MEALTREGKRLAQERIERNLGLVYKTAIKWAGYVHGGVDKELLVTYAMQGAMQASAKFDPSKGAKFTTYATWWMDTECRAAIMDIIRSKHGLRPCGYRKTKEHMMLDRLQKQFVALYGHAPTVEDIVGYTGWSERKTKSMLAGEELVESVEEIVRNRADKEAKFVLPWGADSTDPMDVVEKADTKESINKAVDKLPPRLREIVCKYFGLDGEKARSFAVIAVEMGVSKERIRQLAQRAFGMLRDKLG